MTSEITKSKPEIMAPVGSFESLQAAINAGCNSIYFGVEQLNMRARSAHNFTLDELKEVAEICKKNGIKSYVTMNTLLYEHDLPLMRKIMDTAKSAGISAIIVQDMSAIQYASEIGMPIQASTQLSISNFPTVKFYSQFADTVVLAREVDLKMMKSICDQIEENQIKGPSGKLVKVEVFVHGALCIAQSGRCQMSLLQNNTSAQRGACLQECRKSYKIIDEETGKEMRVSDSQILSPKDLCALPFLDELVATGVSIFKIEGRGRSPQYVDTVVRVYKEAVDAIFDKSFTPEKIKEWMTRLESEYNRGFTEGYYLGKSLPGFSGYSGNRSTQERVFAGVVSHYFSNIGVAELQVQAHEVKVGDKLVFMGRTTGVAYETITEIIKDDVPVENSGKPAMITIKVENKLRKSDKFYILKARNLDAIN